MRIQRPGSFDLGIVIYIIVTNRVPDISPAFCLLYRSGKYDSLMIHQAVSISITSHTHYLQSLQLALQGLSKLGLNA